MSSIMEKIDILSLREGELEQEILAIGEKKFRSSQIYEWLHLRKVTDFEEMSNISAQLRTKLSERFYIQSLKIVRKLESSIDNTVKYLYELSDGEHIEAVVMNYKHGNSLCISTQVGCKMGCAFCASTIAGFKRNLFASEMLLQLYVAERDLGEKISGLVMMGIGEPLDNFDNVLSFLDILSSEKGENMSLRHVSLSTCGLVDKIYELAKYRYGLTLSVSLHAATNEKRVEIMPINGRYNVEQLLTACRHYLSATGRRISFEYAVICGVNDNKQSAGELIHLLKGMNCHVNLIPINTIKERDFRSSKKSVAIFQKLLTDGGLNATVRRTLGSDINAACGQLRREEENL